MLKTAIEKILSLSKPVTVEVNGSTYLLDNNGLYDRVPDHLGIQPLAVNTLTSILDYLANNMDGDALGEAGRFVIHIEDPRHVHLTRELDSDRERRYLLNAPVDPSQFPFAMFLDMEDFIVAVQQHFVSSDASSALIRAVSSVIDSNSVQQADDGISQTVTARSGISLAQKVTLPNPVILAPYRTFREVCQPESPFVFRMRGGDSGVRAALFSADGNAWEMDAIQSIKTFFETHIPEKKRANVILIA